MRIQSIVKNSITFGKQLQAQCDLKNKWGLRIPCKIYELNSDDDFDYFENLFYDKDWQGWSFLNEVHEDFTDEVTGLRAYVMETKRGKCLSFLTLDTDFEGGKTQNAISYIETSPKYSFNTKKRSIKYIGETMLAFVAKLASQNGLSSIYIPVWASTAEDFYKKKCGFQEDELGLYIDNDDFSKLIEQNNPHSNLRFIV